MAEVGPDHVLAGIPAAEGLAIGRVAFDLLVSGIARRAGSPAEEQAALRAAIARAKAEIGRLSAAQDTLAGEILGFQDSLLEDDELLKPVFEAIGAGRPAHEAWDAALEGEIADYRAGHSEHHAARAEDLLDLKLRVLRAFAGAEGDGASPAAGANGGVIVVADDLTPSRFLELDWTRLGGAAIRGGSRTSHVAILARARGVPLIVGLEADLERLTEGAPAVLDAESGRLILAPSEATLNAARARLDARKRSGAAAQRLLDQPAVAASGERVAILINVDDPAILDRLPPEHCDGIGLTRTEFLFRGARLPDEATQLAAYTRVLRWARGRPVTIRTLDAGGDKPIPGVTAEGESNPFLGVRGLRLSLQHEDLFRTQLRALARAAVEGPLKVMVPMVTVPAELDRVRGLMAEVLERLAADGLAHGSPPLGMMVEVPAAALTAESFAADFYSIGSNDLIQYVTAAARDNPRLSAIAEAANPAVIELVCRTVEAAGRRGVEVSLCGDMASDPALVPVLLDCGLRRLSVAPAQVGRVKLAVKEHAIRGTGR